MSAGEEEVFLEYAPCSGLEAEVYLNTSAKEEDYTPEGPIVAVIGVDGSRRAEHAFEWYVRKLHRPDSKVIVIHSVEVHDIHPYPSLFVRPEVVHAEFEKQRLYALDIEERYKRKMAEYEMDGEYVTVAGRPGQAIVRMADDREADIVVVATRGKGKVRRTILGSVSDYVVNHAPCPVMCVRKQHAVTPIAE